MDHLDFEKPIFEIEQTIQRLKEQSLNESMDLSETINQLEKKAVEKKKQLYENLTPGQRVKIVRHPKRPNMLDYIHSIVKNFVEIHGDRFFGDDPAMICGFGEIEGKKLAIVGQQKGKDTKEKLARNFGTAHPEGYRKALRTMKIAEKFNIPILSLIDTPGAFPGVSAEERGQAMAIAVNLMEMVAIKAPFVAVVIGEGGSGGALGIGVADKILMLEHAYYSVISPEGCAAILWKSADRAPDAANALKMTSHDLLGFGLIDEIIKEPMGGAHKLPEMVYENVREAVLRHLDELSAMPPEVLIKRRYDKYRAMGVYFEGDKLTGQKAKS